MARYGGRRGRRLEYGFGVTRRGTSSVVRVTRAGKLQNVRTGRLHGSVKRTGGGFGLTRGVWR